MLPGCVGCPLHQHFVVGVLPETLPGCCCSPRPCRGVPAQGGSQPCSPALWDHVHGVQAGAREGFGTVSVLWCRRLGQRLSPGAARWDAGGQSPSGWWKQSLVPGLTQCQGFGTML